MPLARGQGDLGILAITGLWIHGRAVEENVIRGWRTICLCVNDELVCSLVVVVGQNEWTEINVVSKAGRAVNMDRPDNTIAVLGRKVRMIPTGPILTGNECVGSFTARREGTLSDAIDAILKLIRSKLLVLFWVFLLT